ncbi:Tetratricopeptide-like helical domain-containing protein [Rozella allomycis CSF55]|uniref:Tetratricopeptide-like helical domain-containing protein n=2 Tax=Rozella allomycis (strain CSF55) TaxID=988480 RepID=A0A075AU43_ROZAC|nr:Tetratricopeptide-like helical domain-containing protein [Rozella allomycis CSF55]|eukprot:EPZ32047.1 Tetratricopeptide-like helical domain-containing protein [Rozella allomycis CSF55]
MTTQSIEELKSQGNKAFSSGDGATAVKFFSQAIELDETNHVLYSNRSAAYSLLKDYNNALIDAEKTVLLKKDWAKGYSRKGAALIGLGRIDDAIKAFDEGLSIEPNNQVLIKGKQEAESKKSQKGFDMSGLFNNPKAREFMNDPELMAKIIDFQSNPKNIMKYLNDKKVMEAISVLSGLSRSGDNNEADVPKEEVKEEPKKEEPVKQETKEEEPIATERMESDKEKALGNEFYKKKEFEEALKHYDAAFQKDETNVAVLLNKSAVYFEQGNFEESIKQALETVDKGREIRADYNLIAKAFARVGNCYMKLENYPEAIKYFNKSLTERRNADVLNKLKEAEKLLKEKEMRDYINPEISEKEREKGNELFKAGNYVEAMKHYTESIKRNPSEPKGYSNRAACYNKLAAFPEALKDCEKCLELDPNFIKAYIRKANVEFFMREYSKCMSTCREAMDRDKEGKHTHEIQQQMNQCRLATQSAGSQEEIVQNAMKDPEVQRIMTDPIMQNILQQMQSDPKALKDHLKNPMIADKIQKLIDAGIIRLG